MEVFSSMHPSDIHGGPDKSRGVNAYRDFLEYASQGLLRETGSESGREPGSPFEESVAKVVESYGLEAVFQVGVAGYFIDIGVRRRQGDRSYLLGIECDGATYHSSRSARDRDRLREEIIQGRGWDLYRIWSTDWFLNQKAEEERLVKRLQQCIV
jgi:very-short-patch-repair endonuclease